MAPQRTCSPRRPRAPQFNAKDAAARFAMEALLGGDAHVVRPSPSPVPASPPPPVWSALFGHAMFDRHVLREVALVVGCGSRDQGPAAAEDLFRSDSPTFVNEATDDFGF